MVVPPEDRPGAQPRPETSEEEGLETRSNSDEHEMNISNGLDRAINMRFAYYADQDPQDLHRRRLDAIRAQGVPQLPERRCIDTTTNTRDFGSLGAEPPYTDPDLNNEAVSPLSASLSPLHDAVIESRPNDDADYSLGDMSTCLGEEAPTGEAGGSDIEDDQHH